MYPKIILTGYLSRDPETRAAGPSTVTTTSLAVNCGYGDRQTTQWYTLQQWGDDTQLARQKRDESGYLFGKSSRVMVTGEIKAVNTYIGKNDHQPKVDVVVNVLSIEYVPSGKAATDAPHAAPATAPADDYSALPV
jgi:single-stranded DNA-binding protein